MYRDKGNNCNILIPARFSRLETLFMVIRLHEFIGVGAHTKKTITIRMNLFQDGGQLYYSTGGTNVPSTPVKSNTEPAAELCKALHAFGV